MTPGIRPPGFVAYRLRMLTLSIRLLGLIVRNRRYSAIRIWGSGCIHSR